MKVAQGHWVTINGVHVFIGGNGRVQKGPKNMIGLTKEGVSQKSSNPRSRPKAKIHGGRGAEEGFYHSAEQHSRDIRHNRKAAKREALGDKLADEIRNERKNLHPMLQDSYTKDLYFVNQKVAGKRSTPKQAAEMTTYVHKELSKHSKAYTKPIGPQKNSSQPMKSTKTNKKKSAIWSGQANTGNPHFDMTVAHLTAGNKNIPYDWFDKPKKYGW